MPLITFRPTDSNHPKKGYTDWLLHKLIYFDVPKADAKFQLACSNTMLQTIQESVDYIRVRKAYLIKELFLLVGGVTAASVLDSRSAVYYHREQLRNWLINTPTYTRQTKLISLNEAYRNDPTAVKKHTELREEYLSIRATSNNETKTKEALERLRSHISSYCPQYVGPRYADRKSVPAVSVEPFPWIDSKGGRWFSAADAIRRHVYTNTEMMYRSMFLSGAIKITFGTRKTYFFVPDEPEDKSLVVSALWK